MHSLLMLLSLGLIISIDCFSTLRSASLHQRAHASSIASFVPFESSSSLFLSSKSLQEADDASIQWELFKKHHALGSWKGIWTTVDYMGDVLDETVASVDLELQQQQEIETSDEATLNELVQQTHTIAVGATRSDCKTCFDSENLKQFPVATYTVHRMHKLRCAACGMVNGPILLKSGVMATELILHHLDSRVRVVLQHAPVWERGMEAGQGPPQGLKIFRVLYSREALASAPPTQESEASSDNDNVRFYRPVSPFDWHKKWAGTSWTWGPQIGNRGWALEELDEGDAWHGSAPVAEWNLRLPGGIFIQCPRVITDLSVGTCRLAWLPNADTLLRIEAGVSALQPMALEDESVIAFEPPTLASLRCDVLQKVGDLEGEPQFSRMSQRDALNGPSSLEAALKKSESEDDQRRASVSAPDQLDESSISKSIPIGRTSTAPVNADFDDPRHALRL